MWAGPLEHSVLLTGTEYTTSCYWKGGPEPVAMASPETPLEIRNIRLIPDPLNLNLHSNKMPKGFLDRLLPLFYR